MKRRNEQMRLFYLKAILIGMVAGLAGGWLLMVIFNVFGGL